MSNVDENRIGKMRAASVRKAAFESALQEWRWLIAHGVNVSDEERLKRALDEGVSMAECMAVQQYRRADRLYEDLQRFAVWDESLGQYVSRGVPAGELNRSGKLEGKVTP